MIITTTAKGDNITMIVKCIMIIQSSGGATAVKSKCQVWYKPTGSGGFFLKLPSCRNVIIYCVELL